MWADCTGVPHGEANAILLPHTMRYNLDASAGRQRLIAEAIGVANNGMTDEDAGLAAADAVDALCRELGLPRTLREVDVPEDGLELVAAATLHDREPHHQPQARHRRRANYGGAEGSVLRTTRRHARLLAKAAGQSSYPENRGGL